MRRVALVLVGAALVTLAVKLTLGGGAPEEPERSPAAPPAPLAVGATPPSIELRDHEGRPVTVGGPAEGWTIVTFFRKADLPEEDSPW